MPTREENLIHIIKGLLQNIKSHIKEYGGKYCGGMPIQFAIQKLKELGINIEDE
jgi:hypothetical protein